MEWVREMQTRPDGLTPKQQRFVDEYKSMVDKAWVETGRSPQPIPPLLLNTRTLPIEETGLVDDYSGLYIPAFEKDICSGLESDAKHYVMRVIKDERRK